MSKVNNELKNDPLMPLRHSAEHVLQMSIESLFKDSKKVMGPPIEGGFYGDFHLEQDITQEDLEKITEIMNEIIEADLHIRMKEVSYEEAKEIFADNPYKLEFIEEFNEKGDKISICEVGKKGDKFYDVDLCAGPHVKSTGEIKAFKLLNIAGAYWRGDENNEMLTRIYATAFGSEKELEEYLAKIEEAKERDHRIIGKNMELFTIDDEIGQGLILWLPKGAFIRHKVKEYAFNTYLKRGYEPVVTPHIATESLWSHSGHLDFYKDSMYNSFGIDEEQYRLKPMNCPLQVKMYNIRPRSYRELPLRWTEMGTVYRYEKSGTLHGLTRVRGFTQDDAHIICTPKQLQNELSEALNLTLEILRTFGFEDFEVNLSVRDPKDKDKFFGDDKGWNQAEKALKLALKKADFKDYKEDIGGAVFYGPKIDVKVADSLGRMWQLSTIQLDFNLPEKFDMKYIGEDGREHIPFMIHRALLGSLERFMGVYIEHTKGNFPIWLSPVQIMLIPISEKQNKYAQNIKDQLEQQDIRVEINDKDDTLGAKIRDAQIQKVPYMGIVGTKEDKSSEISIRLRTGEDKGSMPLEDFIAKIKEMDLTKSLQLW